MSDSQNVSRRRLLKTSCGLLGVGLSDFLRLRNTTGAAEFNSASAVSSRPGPQQKARNGTGKAKSCIVLFCWGGMSHFESFDPKPLAPPEIRGEFSPISTAVPGIQVSEHIPLLAQQTNRLAIVRSVHHGSAAHGKGMYWNMTGHAPPQEGTAANLPPSKDDWPSLMAMVSKFKKSPKGMPPCLRLPYPLVDNGTLQAGEYSGWLGIEHDPIVVKTPAGRPWNGVSRSLGSAVLDFSVPLNAPQADARKSLLHQLDRSTKADAFETHNYFQQLAHDMVANEKVRRAFDLDREPTKTRDRYGRHICGQSVLMSRRLVEAGVPIVTVCCAAGDLNGSKGDHWDTHANNFNRLKNDMLPPFDRAASALLDDLDQRGQLDETLVVILTEFGRTPRINGGAGRDHFPGCYSVAFAGGGISGGQVYGSSDNMGARPATNPCGPADLHATIFRALGISHTSTLHDKLGRPFTICDGSPLPLFG